MVGNSAVSSKEVNEKLGALRKEIRAAKRAFKGTPDMIDTGYDLTDLLAIESKEPRRTDRPRTLLLSEIKLAQGVFQHRLNGCDQIDSAHHIKRLKDDINNFIKGIGTEMTPMMVTAIGSEFYLVDGHHRYQAYLQSKQQKKVRVDYFRGNVVAARSHALQSNLTGSLALNTQSRSEAAWCLVVEDNYSKAEIAQLSCRSTSLVGRMRKVRETLLERHTDLRTLSWAGALGADGDSEDRDELSAEAQMVTKIAARMIRTMGVKFPYSPRILAKVLQQIDEDLPGKLRLAWDEDAQSRSLDI